MNGRSEGAIEALGWVLMLIERGESAGKVRVQVNGAMRDLLRGSGRDFRERIKL